MKEDIEVGQIRSYTDSISERFYIVEEFNAERDMVHIKWLENERRETYSIASTLRDRVISELEKELL